MIPSQCVILNSTATLMASVMFCITSDGGVGFSFCIDINLAVSPHTATSGTTAKVNPRGVEGAVV